MVTRLDSLVGEHGSILREWRAIFLRRAPARAALKKVVRWNAERRLIITHGECAQHDATPIISEALSWI